ncbi:MAG TPA: NIPSNAP family protein [Albitalea sp.]|uniref:NIPSNAP family protein n=1 Tax=Piscinibacter sp. TaxID=1903157 RepID=UPI002ED31F19
MNSTHPLQVIELRRYLLHPGQRDTLISLFEREFVETQEALGMQVIGPFRELDDPDRFVWLRGFTDMASRARGLAAFYGGPVWQRHRDAANATMVDSDVHLLRPVWTCGGFGNAVRAPIGATACPPGLVTATICPLPAPADDALVAAFHDTLAPSWTHAGARLLAVFVSETAPNNFPRLPVHEGRPVITWLSLFADAAAQQAHAARLAATPQRLAWRKRLTDEAQTLRLAPTPRSSLHG